MSVNFPLAISAAHRFCAIIECWLIFVLFALVIFYRDKRNLISLFPSPTCSVYQTIIRFVMNFHCIKYYWIQFHFIVSRYTILSVRYYLQLRIFFLPLSLPCGAPCVTEWTRAPVWVRVREDTKRRNWNSGKIKEMPCVSCKYA